MATKTGSPKEPNQFRYHIIVPALHLSAARGLMVNIGTGGAAELESFAVALQDANGNKFYGGDLMATAPMHQKLEAQVGGLPGVRWFRLDAGNGRLQTNSAIGATPGKVWQWSDTLAACGLSPAPEA